MQYRLKILLATLLPLAMALQAYGYTPADSVKVYFRVGSRVYEPSLRNNRVEMERFVDIIRDAKAKDNIERIVVSGYASPDGTSNVNERLARLRCETIAGYIAQQTGVTHDFIKTVPGGVAWGELRNLVEADVDVPSREKILEILDNTPIWIFDRNNRIIGGRKAQLMALDYGEPYRWMLKNLFPELRNAVGLTVFFKTMESDNTVIPELREKTQLATDTVTSENPSSEPIVSETNVIEEITVTDESESSLTDVRASSSGGHKPFFMAVKTNMLYDAALVPNLGAEFYLGNDLSLYGEWMYAWWDRDQRHRYWRVYGGDLGLRWWFGRKAKSKPITGHHLGVYGGILTFDFEAGDTGYLGGKPGGTLWDRFMINVGIEYGYSLPVAKRLNIDFSIGLGYIGGNYSKYFPFDGDYYRQKEYRMHFFGPTKAEISLVWLIGRGNVNTKKGGEK